jgi:uncharacterized membrane protein YccC
MKGWLIGARLLTAVALACAHLLGTDLPAMLITLAGGVWFGYSIRTGRKWISYLATQFALGMLFTLSQDPARAPMWPLDLSACSGSLSVQPGSIC